MLTNRLLVLPSRATHNMHPWRSPLGLPALVNTNVLLRGEPHHTHAVTVSTTLPANEVPDSYLARYVAR